MKCMDESHPDGPCQGEVKERSSMTRYVFTEEDRIEGRDDPNKVVSCDYHYEFYVEYWKEMWAEYWSQVL